MGTDRIAILDKILEKATQEIPLGKEELMVLLGLTEERDLAKVFDAARYLRTRYFKNKIFAYGFVYFSTYCRNECAFCLYRKSNHSLDRYRKSDSEIIETALSLVESGVHLIDLTMGEDPFYFTKGFDPLISVVERIKSTTKIRIMLSAGVLCEEVLKKFRDSGVDWYATYQETHNPKLYQNLRLGQSYDERMERKLLAHKMGYLIEEGVLTGVGDSNEDLVNSLEKMKILDVDQLRVMSFIPQKGTPMEGFPKVPRLKELLLIAVMRLVFPDRLIPASLDVDGLKGLSDRLNSGANVVTSIIPPRSGLAGVSNHSLDIDDGNRTIQRVLSVLEQNGLLLASRSDYDEWVQLRQ